MIPDTVINIILIKRVISSIPGITDANKKPTPTIKPTLTNDEEGLPRKNEFHYRYLIGMLMFLSKYTLPDTQFAVNQCARFSVYTKLRHEKGDKRNFNHLKGTAGECIILKPDPKSVIECHVYADFVGKWHQGEPEES